MAKSKIKPPDRIVCFVGISGKLGAGGPIKPLSEETLSGKIISQVETKLRKLEQCSAFLRDNLVAKAPLHNGKLRYPSLAEMESEWGVFERRLAKAGSNVVILLGRLVADFFRSRRQIQMVGSFCSGDRLLKWAGVDENGTIILAVAHPSYVGVYARKRIGEYVDIIFRTVRISLKETERDRGSWRYEDVRITA